MAWSSAPGWDPTAAETLFEYYVRILPVWPEDKGKLFPHDPALIRAFVGRLSDGERAILGREEREVLAEWSRDPFLPASSTRALLPLLLGTGLLVARGDLRGQDDPAVPLFRLFEAGFEILPHHGGVDLVHAAGLTTVPLPSRSEIATCRAGRGPER